jgi:thiamine biosynthesis lipoprotein
MVEAIFRTACPSCVLALLVLASGAARVDPRYEFTQVHMGMPVRLVLHAPDESQARHAAATAFARIAALEQVFSDYRPDSEVSRLAARHGEPVVVSRELFDVLDRAIEIARLTGGAFDPTVGPLVVLWREARRSGRLPDHASLQAARANVGWQWVELDRRDRTVRLRRAGMRLDLGGIAKGYILQAAVRTLAARGITRVLLEAGGDIVAGDPPPGRKGWSIELPDDEAIDPTFTNRATNLSNAAVATSGATFQFIEIDGIRYSHVIDPRQGFGVTHDRVARVIAPDAATADALATALTIAGPDAVPEIMTRFPGVIAAVSER